MRLHRHGAILNYVYWQTLAVNQFDELGHLLRVTVTEGAPCAHAFVGSDFEEERELYESCNSWLGPDQPGRDRPRPDRGRRGGRRPQARAADAGVGVEKGSTDHGAGEPEAPPMPGQNDWSKPAVVLPPSLQSLLDVLKPQVASTAPAGRAGAARPAARGRRRPTPARDLLDFLLAP